MHTHCVKCGHRVQGETAYLARGPRHVVCEEEPVEAALAAKDAEIERLRKLDKHMDDACKKFEARIAALTRVMEAARAYRGMPVDDDGYGCREELDAAFTALDQTPDAKASQHGDTP